MRADYIENQNPCEYESVRRLIRRLTRKAAKTRRGSSRGRNTKDEDGERNNIISHTASNMWTMVSYMSAKMCMK